MIDHTPKALTLASLLALTHALCACGSVDFENARGADSIFAIFAEPKPAQAAAWAIDPYDADNRYRGTIILANASFGSEELYLDVFKDATQDPSPNVRAAGLRGLANHGRPEHVEIIIERLTDDDDLVRLEAARALQRLHNPIAIGPLIEVLSSAIDPDEHIPVQSEPRAEVRSAAANALGQYAETRVLPVLIATLADADLVVNRNAQSSLETLTGQTFRLDRRAWKDWYTSTSNHFAGRTVYYYPAFSRDRRLIEYLPLTSDPPNEPRATPAGMPPLERQSPPELGPEPDLDSLSNLNETNQPHPDPSE